MLLLLLLLLLCVCVCVNKHVCSAIGSTPNGEEKMTTKIVRREEAHTNAAPPATAPAVGVLGMVLAASTSFGRSCASVNLSVWRACVVTCYVYSFI